MKVGQFEKIKREFERETVSYFNQKFSPTNDILERLGNMRKKLELIQSGAMVDILNDILDKNEITSMTDEEKKSFLDKIRPIVIKRIEQTIINE